MRFIRIGSLSVLIAACAPAPAPVHAPLPDTPAPMPAPARLAANAVLTRASPADVGMDAGLTVRLDSIAREALAAGAASAAVLAVGRHGRLVHLRGYGTTQAAPDGRPVDENTIFDLASLTKVVGATTAAMLLEEQGLLDLDRRVVEYLPELDDPAKAEITVRMLLTHTGGLEAFAPLFTQYRGREQYLEQINRRPLRSRPGTQTTYSDWDLVLLQLIVERQAAQPLDALLQHYVFGALGMHETQYNPPPSLRPRIAATEVDEARGGLIWGEVHDPNAWALGGVAGHAGLFSTAGDLAIFAQMMLNNGAYGEVRLLQPQTVARWTAPQVRGSSRALGWDSPSGVSSAGRFFGPRSYGHTGYTGTSMWLDPERGLFVILLTNRVHPTSRNQRHVPLRRAVADAVQAAVLDAPLLDWEERRQ
jgi:CubicO group peptidase (beta-lactamase class C family)